MDSEEKIEVPHVWLIHPVPFTLARYNGDTTKIKLMVALIEKLQEAIKKNFKKATEAIQLPIFSDPVTNNNIPLPSNKVRIPIYFKDVVDDTHHYEESKELIRSLSLMPIEIPLKDQNNIEYTRYTTFCDVTMPKKKWFRYFYVDIEREVLKKIINTRDLGYHRCLKTVLMACRSRYSQRLYLLVTAWKKQGVVEYNVQWLRKWLDLDKKYQRWASFYNRVILTAQNELQALFDSGDSECCFNTVLIYPKGASRRGEPEKIRFVLVLSEEEMINQSRLDIANMRILCERKLIQFGVSKNNVNKFLKQVDNSHICEFDAELVKLQEKIQREITTISSPSRYATECIRHILSDLKAKNKVAGTPKEDKKRKLKLTVDQYVKEEEQLKQLLQATVNKEAYETWFEPMKIGLIDQSEDGCTITVFVPNQFCALHIEGNYASCLQEALEAVVGSKFTLVYNFDN